MDGNNEVLSPLPKTTQSSERRSVEKKHMTRTTISISTVRTYAVWRPCPGACVRLTDLIVWY